MFGLRNSALLLVSIYLLSATDAFGSTSQQDGQEAVTDFTDRYTSKPPSRGVNIGGWLVAEGWIYPDRWHSYGGELCDDACDTCISTEWALTRKLGTERANQVFKHHWDTWFTAKDVEKIVSLGLDHVRIPIGYWIIEELVDRSTEFYATGGFLQLKRALKDLSAAGIQVVLDLHAMPGVATENQVFSGHCTKDFKFYTDANYQRALTWAGLLTALSHVDPDFRTVRAIEAINEPSRNITRTPGLQDYYTDFGTMVRTIEQAAGIKNCPGVESSQVGSRFLASKNVQAALSALLPLLPKYDINPELISSLRSKTGGYITENSGVEASYVQSTAQKTCLTVQAMPLRWQGEGGASMAKVAIGPSFYDDHLYYSFGGVANATITSYLSHICNNPDFDAAKLIGEVPYGHGEFSISVNFNATDDDLRAWGDAQKWRYSRESSWTFWNFKTDPSPQQYHGYTWSYFDAVDHGLLTLNPNHYFNPKVCDAYVGKPII